VREEFEQHRARRGLFSSAVTAYEGGRPGYPEPVYELLVERCGLGPGTRVLEIGPGTGQATGRLLDLGASVTAIEIGPELADRLRERFAGRPFTVEVGAFEDATIAPGAVDLVVAATSFHWVPTDTGLQRCADVLRADGWLALWWNSFGDPDRPDPFHEALTPILERLAPTLLHPPGMGCAGASAYPLDAATRIAEIDASGRFGAVHHEVVSWTGRHTAEQLRMMFGSFSSWLARPEAERAAALDALEDLARVQFDGLVERPYLTPVYLAQRQK
jgi:SAM-dependent methyltransferase